LGWVVLVFLNMDKVIYHRDCKHISHTSECDKRYYKLFDVCTGEDFKLAVCNDLLRINYNSIINNSLNFCFSDSLTAIRITQSEIIEQYTRSLLAVKSHKFSYSDINDLTCNIQVCKRPFINHSFYLTDIIDFYSSNKSRILLCEIMHTIQQFIYRTISNEKKYHKICRLFKKIDWDNPDVFSIELNEIFIEIFKYKQT
jgi:hypothetical protein